MPSHSIIDTGASRSFPTPHPLLESALPDGEVVVIIGRDAGRALRPDAAKAAVLVELGSECLGVHTGESRGAEGSNMLGFARFRLGQGAPSDLVELVRQPRTAASAIAAATAVLEGAGFEVALSTISPGASSTGWSDPITTPHCAGWTRAWRMPTISTSRFGLGLGHPEGPIELLERTGLAHHHDVTKALFEIYGEPAYAPARRAVVAKQRERG